MPTISWMCETGITLQCSGLQAGSLTRCNALRC